MTHAFLHSLNIGTLSTWLSLAGFGTVAVVVKPWQPEAAPPPLVEETTISDFEFALGPAAGPETPAADAAAAHAEPPAIADLSEVPAETLPAPPELPPLADFEPLPEVPELPAARPAPRQATASAPPSRSGTASASSQPRASRGGGSSASSGSPSATGGGGSGGGMSQTARLAAGQMPAPAYPSAARRGGQTGTVVVEFTVDQSGRVIAAHAAKPSPWPLLNNEAVRTVRRWKFPPGPVMKLQRPIVFQLR